MPGSPGRSDGGAGGGPGAAAATGGDPATRAAGPGAEEAAPRPSPEPDDAAAALRLALDQLSALGLGRAGPPGADGADGGEPEPAPQDGSEAPPRAEPDGSPPAPPPPAPDVFAGFAPHPAALGAPALLAEPLSVIGSRKKSVNMTECVPVPSSEHVAEIVGRQGCKIKALRAKTNTYIKTPVRGEEPVFIVTGRKEDVEMAKREILSAAEHFSLIRASRGKAGGLPGAAPGPPNLPGQTTIQVRVPYRVVGLVVGPKGATIKRIQQRTHTYIVTPGRHKEPVFAVTGMPENVDRAREEIEAHITLRTGAFADSGPDSDFHANGTDVCLDLLGAAGLWAKASHPGRQPPTATTSAGLRGDGTLGPPEAFYAGSRAGPPGPDPGPASPYSSSGNTGFTFAGDSAGTPAPEDCDFGFDFLALDLSVPTAATIWAPFERAPPALPTFSGCTAVNGTPGPPQAGARRGSGTATPRHSPTLPEPGASSGLGLELPLARRGAPDPVCTLPWRPPHGTLPPFSSGTGFSTPTALDTSASDGNRKSSAPATVTAVPTTASAPSSAPAAPAPPTATLARECVVCAEGEAMAALVPCGHNLFCMDCAVRICGRSQPECPACRTPATQAIHIFS